MVPLALIAFVPFSLALFATLPPRRAVITITLAGWLFLPMAGFSLAGLPDFDKNSAPSFSLLLCILIFDAGRVSTFRFRLIDLPILGWCAAPAISVMANGIGGSMGATLYNAFSLSLHYVISYGVPYFVGRLYFTKLEHLRELAIGLVAGAMVYVPFCWAEVGLSPQLHRWVYGFHQHSFAQTIRFGGYRPMVFMQHGLMLGLFMANATLVALWLWRSRAVREIWMVPMGLVTGGLFVTAVACRSAGAMGLLVLGLGVTFASQWSNARFFAIALVAMVPLYIGLRASGVWTGDSLVEMAMQVNEDRAKSLRERFRNENLYVEKAQEAPIVGFAGWNRWQVRDPETQDIITVPDGMWVIALGRFGIVGLASFVLLWTLPIVLLIRAGPPSTWFTPLGGPPAALAVLLCLFMLDSLLNAMVSDYYTLAAGAVLGSLPTRLRTSTPRSTPAELSRRETIPSTFGQTTA